MARVVLLSCLATYVTACAPGTVADAGAPLADAGDATDATDAPACTALPGDLPGERSIGPVALLPPLVFETTAGSISLADLHAPCGAPPELLVVRVAAAWSGPSRWHAAHTARLASLPRVAVLDLLAEGPDALPARVEDLSLWAARYDVPPDALAVDPGHTFAGLAFGGLRLPLVLLVDRRDLRVRRVLFGPSAGLTEAAVAIELSEIDGLPRPPPYIAPLTRGRFTEDEWQLLEEIALDVAVPLDPALAPPPDASNRVADTREAIGLGATLFEDLALSPAGVGCATCHELASERAFTDGRVVGRGVTDVTRNTPTLLGAAHTRWPFWDGRVDSLWAQALGPIESAAEMGSSRLFVAHRVAAVHRTGYEALFGALPDLVDATRFPPDGAPGQPAYDAMAPADQDAVTRVLVNVGKAIAAYERTLVPEPSALDRYVAGNDAALTDTELTGLEMFVDFGCLQCHHGPLLTDDAFHAIDMPGTGTGLSADRGRIAAEAALRSTPFRRTGAYSDDPSATDPLAGLGPLPPSTEGAFRTPTLRALPRTGPYGHAGTFATIREVVEHYAHLREPTPRDPRVTGTLDRHVATFDAIPERIDPITAFLSTL